MRFLIATVPDPLDSHLALDFDRAVDALQRSVGSAGYVLDRLYLPWKKDVQTSWAVRVNPLSSEDGWLTASPKPVPGIEHRRQPGVLLFRRVGPKAAELLLVFLVGETPTSGIQREAFSNALTAVDDFPKGVHCNVRSDDTAIRILGPYFSGSADSLKNALETGHPKSAVQIVSGSATVPENQAILGFSRFHATVAPDDALESEIYRYFRDKMGVCPEREVAVFSEAATGYGQSGNQRDERKPTTSGCDLKPALRIQFPLHVSQLRAAYQQDSALKNGGLFNQGPRHTLELPLEPPEKDPGDILPAQDPRMASVFAELTLAGGIETIRREPIRVVGIRATDPRDVLFLARKIGEARANVVLFAFGAEALFTHPDYQRFLRGMLVATSYPLFPPNQEWTGAGDGRVAFSGFADEGVYNATTLLLGGDDSTGGRLLEYRPPGAGSGDRPPIWIVAIGRGGYWPVRYTPVSGKAANYIAAARSPAPSAPDHIDPPPGSILTFVVVELAVVFLVLLYVQGRRSKLKSARLHLAEELFTAWKDDAVNLQINRTYTVCIFAIAFLVQIAVVSWLAGSSSFFAAEAVGAVLTVAAFVFAAGFLVWIGRIVVLEGAAVHRESSARGWRRWETLVPTAIVIVPVLGAILVVLWQQLALSREDAHAFFARALDFTSALTPVTPFLLGSVVLALWALSSLQRAFLLRVQGTPKILQNAAKSPPPVVESFRGTMELHNGVMECLTDGATRRLAVLVPLAALIPFYPIVFQQYTTIDGDHWSILLKLLTLACYFVILYNYTLFVFLWIRLKRLLHRLAMHPLADAFRRLPDSCTASPWKLWSAVPNVTTLAESVAQLKVLVGMNPRHPAVTAVLAAKLKGAEDLLGQTHEQALEGVSEWADRQRRLRDALTDAAAALTPYLETAWQGWPGPRTALPALKEPDALLGVPAWLRRETPAADQIWNRTAEEFVALRSSAFIRAMFQHLKNQLASSFLGFLFVLGVISSYPFQPKYSVMTFVWVLVFVSISIDTWIFVDMERDPILSFMGKTDPGKISLSADLLKTVGLYIILPLLTLAATQFPGVGDVIFSVFNPAMRSMGR